MSELPEKDPFDEIKVGMAFTGVIDGSFPGGYLITIGVGNCPKLSGVAFKSDQPAEIERNVNENVPIIPTNTSLTQKQKQKKNPLQNAKNPINIDEVPPPPPPPGFEVPPPPGFEVPPPPGFEVQHPLISEYYNIAKFVPVEFKPVNASTRVPITQTNSLDKGKCVSKEYYGNPRDFGIKIDPYLPRKFPSPALANLPPSHLVEQSRFPRNEQQGNNNVVIDFDFVDNQQSDRAEPNSLFPPKKPRHMQDNN